MADLNFSIGFNVEQSGELDSYLKKLQSSLNNIGSKNGQLAITKELGLSAKNAEKLKGMLQQVYNMDGTINVKGLSSQIQQAGGSVELLKAQYMQLGQAGSVAFNNLSTQLTNTTATAVLSSKLLNKAFDTFKNAVRYTLSGMVVRGFVSSIRDAYTYVKNLDTALNDIRIVTGLASDEMDRFAINAQKSAKAMGSDTLSYVKGALLYYQQGIRDMNELTARTSVTTKVSNVTGLDTETATSSLTAVWNGYQVQAADTEKTIDKLAAVAANSAVNLEYLTTAMSKTAAAANTMGLPIDNLNAMIATTGAVTQLSAETIGTAYKTIIARLSDLKVEGFTEEDGITTTYGDISKQLLAAGIDIKNQNGELRDTVDLITEIGSKWQTWDKAQKDAVAIAMAGKRQYTQLFALFDNWDMYNRLVDTSASSVGELQKQQDTYMESTAAHLKKLKTESQRTYSQFIDTEGLNNVIDVLDKLLTKFNDFTGGFSSFGTLLVNIGTTFTTIFSGQIATSLAQTINNFKALQELATLYKQKISMLETSVANNTSVEQTMKTFTGKDIKITGASLDSNVSTISGQATVMSIESQGLSWNLAEDAANKYKNTLLDIEKSSATMSVEQKKLLQDIAQQIAINELKVSDYNKMLEKGVTLRDKDGLNTTYSLQGNDALTFRDVSAAAGEQADLLRNLSSALNDVSKSAVSSGEVYSTLADKLREGIKSVEKGTEAYEKYDKAITKLDKASKLGGAALTNSVKTFKNLLTEVDKSAEAQERTAEAAKTAGEAIDGQGQKLSSTNKILTEYINKQNNAALMASKLQTTIMLISGATKVVNAVTSAIKALGDETKTAAEKAQSLQSTIVSGWTGIGTIIGGIAGGAGGAAIGMAGGGLLGSIISAAIDTEGLEESLKTAKERLEDIEEASNKAYAAQKTYTSSYSDLKSIEEEWTTLSKKVDKYGTDLSNLTEEEKTQYNTLKNSIISMNEDAVIRWDDHGEAIINVNTALDDTYAKIAAIRDIDTGDAFTSIEEYANKLRMEYSEGLNSTGSWWQKFLKKNRAASVLDDQKGMLLLTSGVDTSGLTTGSFGIGSSNFTEDAEEVDKVIEELNRKIVEANKSGNDAMAKALAQIQQTLRSYSEVLHSEEDALEGLQKIDGKVALLTLKIDTKFNYDDASEAWDESLKSFFDDIYQKWADGKDLAEFETAGIEIGEELSAVINTGFADGLQDIKDLYDLDLISVDTFREMVNATANNLKAAGLDDELTNLLKDSVDFTSITEAFDNIDFSKFVANGTIDAKKYLESLSKSELEIAYKIIESRDSVTIEELEGHIERLSQLGDSFSDKMDFKSFFEGLDESVDGVENLTKAMEQLKEGTALTKSQLLDLIDTYPELMNQEGLFDLDASGQEAALNSILDMQELAYDKQIDAKIAELEAQRLLIQDLLALETEKENLLNDIQEEANNGRLTQEADFVNKLKEYNDLQSENFFRMEEGKLVANDDALNGMLAQEGDYATESTTNIWSPYAEVITTSHEEGLKGGLQAIADYGSKLAQKLKDIAGNVLTGFAGAVKAALAGDLEGAKSAISGIFTSSANDITVDGGSVNVLFKGSEATIDKQEIDDWVSEQKEATEKRVEALKDLDEKTVKSIDNLKALKGLNLGDIYASDDSGKDKSGGGKEKEPLKYDKIAKSLENAALATEKYKKAYDNAHDSASRLDALDGMTAAIEDLRAAIYEAIEAYKKLLEEYGKDPNLPADVKALIDGDMDYSEVYETLNEDLKKAVDNYESISDTIEDLEEEELDLEEEARQAWLDRIDEIKNKYASMIGEMENEADALQDSIKYQETVGEFVLGDNYFALIDNAKKQLGTYEDELSDLYDMLDSAPDADARLDIEDEIRSIESSMRDLTLSIAEYVETLKSIPNNIYSNMLSMVSNNASDINNAIAEATSHGLQTTQAQYEALIKNSAESTKYLERQRSFLQKMLGTYQVGSDKYYEVLTQLQAVDDLISKNTQDTYKWQQSILEISYSYIEEAQSEIDKQINVIQNDIDDIQDLIDDIDDEIEKISRKIELIQRVIDNEEEKQDEWQEIIQAVADAYQDAIDKLTDERTAYEESMNSKIDLLNEQLDLLNESNEALDKQLAIEQALYDLDKAREQQTVRVIRNGKVSYEADQNAVRLAENAYAEALYNKKVYDLQQEIKVLEDERDKQLEAYDDLIEALNELAEVWSTIVENIEKAVRAAKASEYFGSEDWAIKITGDAEYSKQLADIMSAQYGKSVELVNRLNDEVKVLEDLKLILEDLKYDLNQQIEKLNKQIELLEDQKEILDDTKSTIEDFVKQWLKGQINFDQAMAAIQKTISADLKKEINGNDSQVNKITSYSGKQVQVTQTILDQLTQAENNAYAATQVKTTSTRSSSRSSSGGGSSKSSGVSMGYATVSGVSVGRSDIGPGGSASSLATAQSIAKQYASGDVAGAKAAAAAGGYKIETKAEGGVIGGGTLPNRLMDLIRKAYGADAMPLIGHKGELVLNRDQQANLIKNIQSAQLAAMFANPRFRNAGADSAQVISITMGNLTLPNVQNGNDFADFIANNLETAVGQRVNRK